MGSLSSWKNCWPVFFFLSGNFVVFQLCPFKKIKNEILSARYPKKHLSWKLETWWAARGWWVDHLINKFCFNTPLSPLPPHPRPTPTPTQTVFVCMCVGYSVFTSVRLSTRLWCFGFSLISWKGSDWNSSNFSNTLISATYIFIIET